MNFPSVGNSVAERRIQRPDGETVPEVAVGIVKQGVGTEPQVLSDRGNIPSGACWQEVVEGGVGTRRNERPILERSAVGQGGMAPKAVEFSGVIAGHPVRIFLRSRVPLRFAHETISIYIKAVVVRIQGEIAPVQGVKRRTVKAQINEVKTAHALAHVGFETIGHPVSIGVGHSRVKVHTVAVLIQFTRQPSRETRSSAICRIGPTKLLRGVEPVKISVRVRIGGIVFVQSLHRHGATVRCSPVHPPFKQGLVDIGNQVTVRIGVWRRRLGGVIGVNVGDV